jgi:hypothetical protein
MRDIIKKNSVQKIEKPAQIKKVGKTAIKSQQGAKNVII